MLFFQLYLNCFVFLPELREALHETDEELGWDSSPTAHTAPTASHNPRCCSFLLKGNETKTAGGVGDDRACLDFTEPHTDPHIKEDKRKTGANWNSCVCTCLAR